MGRLMFLAGAGPPISSLVGQNTIAPLAYITVAPHIQCTWERGTPASGHAAGALIPEQGPWQSLRWRWKLTIAGIAMGAIACGLWTAPAAWFAFRGGYTTHGFIYAVSVAVVMVLAPVGMHIMGIRHERDFDDGRLTGSGG